MESMLQELVKRKQYDRPIAGYVPSNALTGIAIALYSIVTGILWIHWFRNGRHRWMLTLTIGATCMTIGFWVRIALHYMPFSLGVYIITTLFTLLSPCAFLAADYVALSRMAVYLGRNDVTKNCLIVPATLIVKFFVISDITTFLIQAAGGGITASGQNNASLGDVGEKISMAGLSLQGASFASYTIILLYFGYRVRKMYPEKWYAARDHPDGIKGHPPLWKIFDTTPIVDWRILYKAVCLTCIGFLLRSGFRIAEFSGGYNGYIYTHEGYMYGLDSLPLLLGISVYIFVWPPRFMKHAEVFEALSAQSDLKESGTAMQTVGSDEGIKSSV